MYNKLTNVLVAAILISIFGLTAAQAQKDAVIHSGYISDGPQFEIVVSSFASDLPTSAGGRYEPQFGLRGSFHLSNNWVLEGSASRYGNYDVWFVDASAKYYLKNSGRVGAYVLGGPGMLFGSDAGIDKATVHLGVGLEIPFSERFYLRPEVRGVALMDDLATAEASYSLGVGWRM
jgi:Outer membrane protein beta-barrel domain